MCLDSVWIESKPLVVDDDDDDVVDEYLPDNMDNDEQDEDEESDFKYLLNRISGSCKFFLINFRLMLLDINNSSLIKLLLFLLLLLIWFLFISISLDLKFFIRNKSLKAKRILEVSLFK